MKQSIPFTKFSDQECSTNENQLPSATLSVTSAKEINFNCLTDADQNQFIKSASECYQDMELTGLDDEQHKTLAQNGPAYNQEMELTNLDDEEQKTMKKHGPACDEVRKVERSNKRSNALRNWKWDEVIEIVSSEDDWKRILYAS